MECNDPRCPVHGQLKTKRHSIRRPGRKQQGKKSAIVQVDYTIYLYKYERYLRKHSRVAAHNPECINAKAGDIVNVAETRRISKTKSFAITGIVKPKA